MKSAQWIKDSKGIGGLANITPSNKKICDFTEDEIREVLINSLKPTPHVIYIRKKGS